MFYISVVFFVFFLSYYRTKHVNNFGNRTNYENRIYRPIKVHRNELEMYVSRDGQCIRRWRWSSENENNLCLNDFKHAKYSIVQKNPKMVFQYEHFQKKTFLKIMDKFSIVNLVKSLYLLINAIEFLTWTFDFSHVTNDGLFKRNKYDWLTFYRFSSWICIEIFFFILKSVIYVFI